jgi:hypothetical protein
VSGIVDYALRVAMVYALRGRTYAGTNVFDSPNDPITESLDGDDAKVVIAVFLNSTNATVEGEDILHPTSNAVDLMVQAFMPDKLEIQLSGGSVAIRTRNEGGQFAMNMLERQIERVLLADDTPWATFLRRVIAKHRAVKTQSFVVQTDRNVEITARETVFTLETCDNPGFGTTANEFWNSFLTLMAGEPALAPLVPVVRAEIESPNPLTDWRIAAIDLGVDANVPQMLGLGPVRPATTTPLLQKIVIDSTQHPDVIVDEPLPP